MSGSVKKIFLNSNDDFGLFELIKSLAKIQNKWFSSLANQISLEFVMNKSLPYHKTNVHNLSSVPSLSRIFSIFSM